MKQMRTYFLFLLCTFSTLTIQAQTQFGMGWSCDLNYFAHEDYQNTRVGSFQPAIGSSLGLITFLNFRIGNRFDLGLRVSLGRRKITLSSKDPKVTGNVKNLINFGFLFSDFSIYSSYEIKTKKGFTLHPTLGFFLSYNHFNGFGNSTFTSNLVNRFNIIPGFTLSTDPRVLYPGINLGVTAKMKMLGVKIMPFLMFYLSPPKRFFDLAFSTRLQFLDDTKFIQGSNQYLSLGVNFPFRRGSVQ